MAGESPNPTAQVALRQRVGSSCEFTQPASLVAHEKYAFLELAGSGQQIFSPELGIDDMVVVANDLDKSLLNLARNSGFRLERHKESLNPSPEVLRKKANVQCPTVEEARRVTIQDRERRRREIQSKLHRPGYDGVTAPAAIATPRPTLGENAPDQPHAANNPQHTATTTKYRGKTILEIVVGPDGSVPEVKVVHSLSTDLDNKAMEAVKKWKFIPATKDGLAVPVVLNVEVEFHLY